MSKTNTEKMAPETQTPEMANGMKLDVRVRPIAPMGNLLAFANVIRRKHISTCAILRPALPRLRTFFAFLASFLSIFLFLSVSFKL